MGKALSAFRPKSDIEKLDYLTSTINSLEEIYLILNHKRERWMENIATYGIGIYFLFGGLVYLFYFPEDRRSRKTVTLCYALHPLLLLTLKELIGWFFKFRINKTVIKIGRLKNEKKQVVELILGMEPFKTLKTCIIEESEGSNLKSSITTKPSFSTASLEDKKLRNSRIRAMHFQSKSLLEKIFDFIAGEGSNNRYALICSQCGSHNGLALKEEYEYISFRCCCCNHNNTARKVKPNPPKLGIKTSHFPDETSSENEIVPTKVLIKPQMKYSPYSSSSVIERCRR